MSHDAMAAGRFYETMFGAKIVASKGADGLPRCNMRLGGQLVLISTVDESVTQVGSGPHTRLGLDHLGIRVDDMAQALAELKAKGAEFLMEPRGNDRSWIAFVAAPDGVSVELVQSDREMEPLPE
jgi:catechol 2,3-dioxygenase-like lactoylglutathione lyase family enzyme